MTLTDGYYVAVLAGNPMPVKYDASVDSFQLIGEIGYYDLKVFDEIRERLEISRPKSLTVDVSNITNKVNAIKAVRGIARIGLKEAKSLIEVQGNINFSVSSVETQTSYQEWVNLLQSSGAIIL